jgi:hypothetical protein
MSASMGLEVEATLGNTAKQPSRCQANSTHAELRTRETVAGFLVPPPTCGLWPCPRKRCSSSRFFILRPLFKLLLGLVAEHEWRVGLVLSTEHARGAGSRFCAAHQVGSISCSLPH